MMHIEHLTVNVFQENTYILSAPDGTAVVVDPGCLFPEETQMLKQRIQERHLKVQAVLLTHAHLDHIFGVDAVCDAFKVPLYAHAQAPELIQRLPQLCSMYGLPPMACRLPDYFLADGDVFTFGEVELECMHVPGHSPDHLVFIHHHREAIIGGDVLFKDSIGRTDLPGGDHDALIRNIKEKLFLLPDTYQVYPGHGPQTLLGREKQFNPFLQ